MNAPHKSHRRIGLAGRMLPAPTSSRELRRRGHGHLQRRAAYRDLVRKAIVRCPDLTLQASHCDTAATFDPLNAASPTIQRSLSAARRNRLVAASKAVSAARTARVAFSDCTSATCLNRGAGGHRQVYARRQARRPFESPLGRPSREPGHRTGTHTVASFAGSCGRVVCRSREESHRSRQSSMHTNAANREVRRRRVGQRVVPNTNNRQVLEMLPLFSPCEYEGVVRYDRELLK
jgi:hypothetical protein